MDTVVKMQLLSMKRGVFMDKVGEGGSSVCRRHVRDMLEVYFIGERMIFLTDRGFICIFVRLVMKFI